MTFRGAKTYLVMLIGLFVLFAGKGFGQGISREDYSGLDKYLSDLIPPPQPKRKGAEFLEIPVEARGVALGGAYSAVGTSISSLWWNPAGLSHLSSIETSVSHLRYNKRFDSGIDYSFFSAGVPIIRDKFVVGGYLGYFDLPHLNITTVGAPEGTGKVYKPYEYQAAVSIAYRIYGNLAVGVSAKRVYQDLYGASGSALALDAGALYEYNLAGQVFSLSFAVQNVGQDLNLKSDPLLYELPESWPDSGRHATLRTPIKYGLPISASLGLGYRYAFNERAGILFAYEYRRPKQYPVSFKNIQSMGMEFSVGLSRSVTVFVRGGRRSLAAGNYSGLSYFRPEDRTEADGGFGLLLHLLGRRIHLDYARESRDRREDYDYFTLRVGL